MASRAPGWILMKFGYFLIKNHEKNGLKSSRRHFSIKNQPKKGLKSSMLDSYEIWIFSINNQLKNGLKSPRLDSYEIWWLFNQESTKKSPQELQARFIWNLIIFQLTINCRMASKAPDWIHIKFNDVSIKNQVKNGLKWSRLDSYEISSFFN